MSCWHDFAFTLWKHLAVPGLVDLPVGRRLTCCLHGVMEHRSMQLLSYMKKCKFFLHLQNGMRIKYRMLSITDKYKKFIRQEFYELYTYTYMYIYSVCILHVCVTIVINLLILKSFDIKDLVFSYFSSSFSWFSSLFDVVVDEYLLHNDLNLSL